MSMPEKFCKSILDENLSEFSQRSLLHLLVAKLLAKFDYARMQEKCVTNYIVWHEYDQRCIAPMFGCECFMPTFGDFDA